MELRMPVCVLHRRPAALPLSRAATERPAIAEAGDAQAASTRFARPGALLLGLGLAGCFLAGPAAAQTSVVIYRCTDADGMVSLQNDVPCPKASRQERRVIDTVPPPSPARPVAPAPAPPAIRSPAATTAASPDHPARPAPITERADDDATAAGEAAGNPTPDGAPGLLPPPPLFSCRTWEREDFLTDDEVPVQRCAPLRVTGLGGAAEGGAGLACQTVRDTCTPVPEPALCAQWQQYVHDRQAVLTFGRAANPAQARAELERVSAIFRRSHCAR